MDTDYKSSSAEELLFMLGDEALHAILEGINRFVWGAPALILILSLGIYLTVRCRLPQIRYFPDSIRFFTRKMKKHSSTGETVSPFQALCTALAATVGTGNIAGVAGAIAIGGPGAVFWMWVCAFFGMLIKFTEATLAVHFRKKGAAGEYTGGPMYLIELGIGKHWKWLASCYAFLGVVAAFGVGNATQINAVIASAGDALAFLGHPLTAKDTLLLAVILALIITKMLLGGGKRIGRIAESLVPVTAVGYILLCLIAILSRPWAVPHAFMSILRGAFTPAAVTGGVIGSAFRALRIGVSRGVFTNEAGMGTASIAHAGANVRHPVEQGLLGMLEVFIDTVVICTMTALVILSSGIHIPYGLDEGAALTIRAFTVTYGKGISVPIAIFLICFALATVLGWGLYGCRCAQYLFGERSWRLFALLQGLCVIFSALIPTDTVWMVAETVNGLMAIPNLIALFYLSGKFASLLLEYNKGHLSALKK